MLAVAAMLLPAMAAYARCDTIDHRDAEDFAAAEPVTEVAGTVETIGIVPVSAAASAGACLPLPWMDRCAAVGTTDVTGEPIILVLGYEEDYALLNLDVDRLGWRDAVWDYGSLFASTNPMTWHFPNRSLSRRGNPYFPYHQVKVDADDVLEQQRAAGLPATLTPTDAATLSAVQQRYQGLTPQQAMALGYQPATTFTSGLGVVYLNQGLLDNTFDPMQPEALSFTADGRLAGVHYLLRADQPFTAFGQTTVSSAVVPGTQQLTVWLYLPNPNGIFALRNPNLA
jgi:hypothetical protein